MMVRSPAISAHKRRSLSQRARRDAEAEQRGPAPAYLPHGAVVGEAAELANLAGKMIGSAKVQVEYYALRKEAPTIEFLRAPYAD